MSKKRIWRLPVLLVLAIVLVLAMLRLGVWQLDRAAQKQNVLDKSLALSRQAAVDLGLLTKLSDEQRFLPVTAKGQYLKEQTLYLDNQVFNRQVGYQIITPFKLEGSNKLILVARGWIAVGPSRERLPAIETPAGLLTIKGRLNLPVPPPPLWNDDYAASDGARWQYIDLDDIAQRYQQALQPLVLELHPTYVGDQALLRAWDLINDEWVAKHKAYAFQWFSMAAAFFIACLVLLLRERRKNNRQI